MDILLYQNVSFRIGVSFTADLKADSGCTHGRDWRQEAAMRHLKAFLSGWLMILQMLS